METADVLVVRDDSQRVRGRYLLDPAGALTEVSHRPWLLVAGDVSYLEYMGFRVAGEDLEFYVWDRERLTYRRYGGPVYRVEAEQPAEVGRLAEELDARGHPVSLANIRYEARVSLDAASSFLGVKVPVPLHYRGDELASLFSDLWERTRRLRLVAWDIEVASTTGGFPRPGDPVFLMSVCVGELGGEPECYLVDRVDPSSVREALLAAPWNVTWNGLGFDVPYLRAYLSRAGGPGGLGPWGLVEGSRGSAHIDAMEVLGQHYSAFGLPAGRRLALDDAAAALGLASREELEVEERVDRARIYQLYRENPRLVERYALTDAALTWRLGRLVLETLVFLYVLTGISPSVVQVLPTLGSLAEYAVFDLARRRDRVVYQLRSASLRYREREDLVGPYAAHTKELFRRPLYRRGRIVELDYNMLYPTIYATRGVDPAGSKPCPGGYPLPMEDGGGGLRWIRFCPGEGPVASLLRYFYQTRRVTKQLKKRLGAEALDQAVKILANSGYGMFSKGRGNGLNELSSAYIFFYSNQILLSTIGYVERVLGLPVVYAATDAVFIDATGDPRPADEIAAKVNTFIAAAFGEEYSVKVEAEFEAFALVKPKTYFALPAGAEEAVVKGIEKLPLPRAVKDEAPQLFAEQLRSPGRGRRLLMELLASGDPDRLTVRSSRRLSDLYNRDEKRFKEPVNLATRAALVTYALTVEGQRPGRIVVHLTRETLREQGSLVVQARWLTPGGGRLAVWVAGGVYLCEPGRWAAGSGELVYETRCAEASFTRRDVSAMAVRLARPLIEYMRKIEELAGGGLARFL